MDAIVFFTRLRKVFMGYSALYRLLICATSSGGWMVLLGDPPLSPYLMTDSTQGEFNNLDRQLICWLHVSYSLH